MEILAIDDEKIALEELVDSIRQAEPSAVVHSFMSAQEALGAFTEYPCQVAFVDIQMETISGVEFAKQLKLIYPRVNIIFATGHVDYREDAFDMHASGYITKPITAGKVRKELDDLRYPVIHVSEKKMRIQTFGNFEVYADEEPLNFTYDKTKEMFAYLVDRRGAYCSNREIMAVLWQDDCHTSYLSNLKKDLKDTLKAAGCSDVIESGWGKIRLCTENVTCDYFDWCDGKVYSINQYRGEYMVQYSWAEFTAGILDHKI